LGPQDRTTNSTEARKVFAYSLGDITARKNIERSEREGEGPRALFSQEIRRTPWWRFNARKRRMRSSQHALICLRSIYRAFAKRCELFGDPYEPKCRFWKSPQTVDANRAAIVLPATDRRASCEGVRGVLLLCSLASLTVRRQIRVLGEYCSSNHTRMYR
jgi:hypothetical protein